MCNGLDPSAALHGQEVLLLSQGGTPDFHQFLLCTAVIHKADPESCGILLNSMGCDTGD